MGVESRIQIEPCPSRHQLYDMESIMHIGDGESVEICDYVQSAAE